MNEQLQNELIAWQEKWQCAAEMAAQAEADLWETKQQLTAERALADRLAEALTNPATYVALEALAAWKEARGE